MEKLKLFQRGGLIVLLCLLGGTPVFGAKKALDELSSDVLQNYQQTQQVREAWSKEEKQLLSEIEWLSNRQQQLQQQSEQFRQVLQVENRRVTQQHRRLTETKKLRNGLLVLLQGFIQQYVDESGQSLPFLAAEREKRQADLETVLVDPYTPLYEKFRRVFEVFLVETEFAYSSEVYRDNIQVSGTQLQVDLLRIGRTALFFRTPDGSKSGYFDPSNQQFQFFPGQSTDLSRAFAMVRREAAPEMVSLPVGRIIAP
jgi:hypothetical protein